VPAGTVLEIGPGFGRWTQYLRRLCDHLILVDLSARCIEACRARFADDPHIDYFANDGESLAMIPDRSIDFLFSFDSLVHVEADALGAYLAQAARKLKPGGTGFVHHSNLGAFVHPKTGEVRRFVTQRNWRAQSMSAGVFRRLCDDAGLACRSQEMINWIGRGQRTDQHHLNGRCIPLTDCLSVFTTADGQSAPTRVIVNHSFVDEWRQAIWIADAYVRDARSDIPAVIADDSAPLRPLLRKLRTARALRRIGGVSALATVALQRASAASAFAVSAAKAHLMGEANRWFTSRHIAGWRSATVFESRMR
jgi:2-polyprenyl-3-methyl-5-hydroxy-6-metoxy-1,4-benzoquinol methylase